MTDFWSIGSWLLPAAIAYGGAVATLIGLAPTRVGDKLLGHHLERRLASLKHEQNEQIEELKEQLTHFGDRGKRSNEREFEAISAVWDKFVEAFLSTNACAISFISYPDLDRLSDEELAAFLGSTDFSDGQKKQVEGASDKNRIYSKIVMFRQVYKAGTDIFEARLLLRTKGIFIPQELIEQFQAALEMLSKAHVERLIDEQHGRTSGAKEVSNLLSNGDRVFDALQVAVRTRLLRA